MLIKRTALGLGYTTGYFSHPEATGVVPKVATTDPEVLNKYSRLAPSGAKVTAIARSADGTQFFYQDNLGNFSVIPNINAADAGALANYFQLSDPMPLDASDPSVHWTVNPFQTTGTPPTGQTPTNGNGGTGSGPTTNTNSTGQQPLTGNWLTDYSPWSYIGIGGAGLILLLALKR